MINNFGLETQFAALGGRVYKLARERGLGYEIPYDLLLFEDRWEV